MIKRTILLMSQFFCACVLQANQKYELSELAAKSTIAGLTQEISKAQQELLDLYQKDFKVKNILNEISQMSALKNVAGIPSIENQLSGIQDQLNQNTINMWTSSVDPLTNINPIQTISHTFNAIFIEDPIIKEKMEQVSMLKREIGDRIAQKGWLSAIQKIGVAIETIAPNEIKQVSQSLSNYQLTQTQIVSAHSNNAALAALEKSLAIQQLNLKSKIIQNQVVYEQLLRVNNKLKKINFMLDLMQNPSKITNITQDSITSFESPFTQTIF